MFIMNDLYKITILLYLVQDFFFILFQWINNFLILFYYKNNQKQLLLVKYKLKLFLCLLLKKTKTSHTGKHSFTHVFFYNTTINYNEYNMLYNTQYRNTTNRIIYYYYFKLLYKLFIIKYNLYD